MLGWTALPIMVIRGLSLRSKQCTPFLWTAACNLSGRRSFHSVCSIRKTRYIRSTKGIHDDGYSDIFLAKKAFDVLARNSRSWKRLGSIVDLALDENISNQPNQKSICDVGTDHGLLATGLAMTSRFDRVLGVDVSEPALRDGALKLQNDIRSYRNKITTNVNTQNELNVEFRLSDGLQNVHVGEADIICIAGMGVHSMVDILTARGSDSTKEAPLLLDILETRRLILQPTNSRPRHLLHLYNRLNQLGWQARAENIDFVSSRWYVTVEFVRSNYTAIQFPGILAMTSNTSKTTEDWVVHHKNWIRVDSAKTGSTNQNDGLWLEAFDAIK